MKKLVLITAILMVFGIVTLAQAGPIPEYNLV